MADPLITPEDLRARLQRTIGTEQALRHIDDASALLRVAVDDATLGVAGGTAVPDALIPVVVRVVDRALANPHGLTAEAIGGHSWQAPAGGSGVHLTAHDVRDARRAVGKLPAGVVTLTGDLPTHIGRAAAGTPTDLIGSL